MEIKLVDLKLEQLKKAISTYKPISEAHWQHLLDNHQFRSLKRKAYFLRAGEVATDICFICSGLLRLFYLTEDGQEYNRGFVSENHFCSAHASAILKEPSRFSIQAMEPTELIVLKQDTLLRNPFWRELQLLNIEQMFLKKEKKEAQFLLDSPKDRYLSFLQDHPGIASRISDHHIASYLGITPVHLSRIKKSKNP